MSTPVSVAVARPTATLVILVFSGTLATALSICDAQKGQQAKQAERTLASNAACDRPAILKAYHRILEELTRQAGLAKDHFGFKSAEATSYQAEIELAKESLAGLKDVAATDHSSVQLAVTDVEGKIQAFMGRIRNSLAGLDNAGLEPVCEADLSWKRSQIWKTAWGDCPAEPESESEQPTSTSTEPADETSDS